MPNNSGRRTDVTSLSSSSLKLQLVLFLRGHISIYQVLVEDEKGIGRERALEEAAHTLGSFGVDVEQPSSSSYS